MLLLHTNWTQAKKKKKWSEFCLYNILHITEHVCRYSDHTKLSLTLSLGILNQNWISDDSVLCTKKGGTTTAQTYTLMNLQKIAKLVHISCALWKREIICFWGKACYVILFICNKNLVGLFFSTLKTHFFSMRRDRRRMCTSQSLSDMHWM